MLNLNFIQCQIKSLKDNLAIVSFRPAGFYLTESHPTIPLASTHTAKINLSPQGTRVQKGGVS